MIINQIWTLLMMQKHLVQLVSLSLWQYFAGISTQTHRVSNILVFFWTHFNISLLFSSVSSSDTALFNLDSYQEFNWWTSYPHGERLTLRILCVNSFKGLYFWKSIFVLVEQMVSRSTSHRLDTRSLHRRTRAWCPRTDSSARPWRAATAPFWLPKDQTHYKVRLFTCGY